MTGALCPGSGQPAVRGWCGECMAAMPSDPLGGALILPHTVDVATGAVWVRVGRSKPPEPDPWAAALWTLATNPTRPWSYYTSDAAWGTWHAVAAEARRLAAADPALRAAHWSEVRRWLAPLPHVGSSLLVALGSTIRRIEQGEQP